MGIQQGIFSVFSGNSIIDRGCAVALLKKLLRETEEFSKEGITKYYYTDRLMKEDIEEVESTQSNKTK